MTVINFSAQGPATERQRDALNRIRQRLLKTPMPLNAEQTLCDSIVAIIDALSPRITEGDEQEQKQKA